MLYLSKRWYVRFCVSMMHDNDDNSETKIIIKKRITLNRQHEWAITTGMNPILIGGQTKITPHEYENYMLGCIQTYTLHRKTVRHDRCYFSIRAYAWALYWMLCYAMLCCVVFVVPISPQNIVQWHAVAIYKPNNVWKWCIPHSIDISIHPLHFGACWFVPWKATYAPIIYFIRMKRDSLAFSNTKSYTNAAQLQPVTSYNFQHKK